MSLTDQSQKTEEPTPKRLADARKRGEQVKSVDLAIWFSLIGILFVAMMMRGVSADLSAILRAFIERPHAMPVDSKGLQALSWQLFAGVGGAVGVLFLVTFMAALIGQVAQAPPIFSTEKLKPDISKLNPLSGFKRVLGREAIGKWLRDLVKLGFLGLVIWAMIAPHQRELDTAPGLEIAALPKIIDRLGRNVLTSAIMVIGVLGAVDYFFQWRAFIARNRMSRQEIIEEFKETEGDPQLKAKLRQIREERSKRRIIQSVPTATVIVTNPTHYAVALRYVEDESPAPICVAKGLDAVALRIRAIAQENSVPIMEDPPLARALHATAELDQPIPREHYEAVARIIGYIMQVNAAKAAGRRVPPPPRLSGE